MQQIYPLAPSFLSPHTALSCFTLTTVAIQEQWRRRGGSTPVMDEEEQEKGGALR